MYKTIFIDLDDTLWAFSQNACNTFRKMYTLYGYDRFFSSFDHFYTLYESRNMELWIEYGDGRITKDELNKERFSYPLKAVGCHDEELPQRFALSFFKEIALQKCLMPNAKGALDYLSGKYDLYILSNGFHGLQQTKMASAGIEKYFKKTILSEDAGVHKPYKEIFEYALSVTDSQADSSIMIGDSWENDIVGARNAGMAQGYYNVANKETLGFNPTFVFNDWVDINRYL